MHTRAVTGDSSSVEILGIRFSRRDADATLREIERLFGQDAPAWIAVENAHALNLAVADPRHRETLRKADIVLNDGKGVMLAARILGTGFPLDLNGNHFTPLLLRRAAERGWSTFFFGAAPGVAARAAERLTERIPGLDVVGTHHGYVSESAVEGVLQDIRESGAEVLLVGLGMPLQEQWIDRYLARTGARLGVTVGAFFDFQAGRVRRAPAWMNRAGIEWLHRLAVEPRRLWKRYLIGNPVFIGRVLRQRLRRGRVGERALKGSAT